MGYYSNFEIYKFDESDFQQNITDEELEKLSDITGLYFEGPYIDDVKWYNIIENMIEFSKKYPEYKWIVYQEGEDRGDYRKYIFKNRKYKEFKGKVTVIYPDENSIEWKGE